MDKKASKIKRRASKVKHEALRANGAWAKAMDEVEHLGRIMKEAEGWGSRSMFEHLSPK